MPAAGKAAAATADVVVPVADDADSDDAAAESGAVAVRQATGAAAADVQRPETTRIAFPKPTRASALEASPDGKWLAVGTSFGDVYVANTSTGVLSLVTSIGEGTIEELAWSPDSQWLAWSEPVTSFGSRSRLRLASVTEPGGSPVEVTDGRFCDQSPSFTPDGKFLAFLSNRSFDPVYDGHSFDLSFPSPIKPYLVALAATTPSPFGPAVDLAPAAGIDEETGGQTLPRSGWTPKDWPTVSSVSRCRRATTPR